MILKKIARYNPYGNVLGEKYDYVCQLLSQKVDPPSSAPNSVYCLGRNTYHSTHARAAGCIRRDTAQKLIATNDLNEVGFHLADYCDESTFREKGSTAVREAFLQAFVDNNLIEDHVELHTRLENIGGIVATNPVVLAISHTFTMKLFQVFWEVGGVLFEAPQTLRSFIEPTKHLFPFEAELHFNEAASPR